MPYLLTFAGLLLFDVVSLSIISFSFMTLWGWFLVPLGLRSINMALAFGILLIVGRLINPTILALDLYSDIERMLKTGVFNVLMWLTALCIGYAIHSYV